MQNINRISRMNLDTKKYKNIFWTIALFLFTIVLIPLLLSSLFGKTAIENGKIAIEKHVNAPFLSNINQDTIVLFFGYVGCINACAPTLTHLSKIYASPNLKILRSSVVFVFVNLIPEIPKEQPQIFANSFNKEFIGLHLSRHELLNIEREFALFYSTSIVDKSEMAHSDFVYLIKRENGKLILKNAYTTHPLNQNSLINDINNVK